MKQEVVKEMHRIIEKKTKKTKQKKNQKKKTKKKLVNGQVR